VDTSSWPATGPWPTGWKPLLSDSFNTNYIGQLFCVAFNDGLHMIRLLYFGVNSQEINLTFCLTHPKTVCFVAVPKKIQPYQAKSLLTFTISFRRFAKEVRSEFELLRPGANLRRAARLVLVRKPHVTCCLVKCDGQRVERSSQYKQASPLLLHLTTFTHLRAK